MAHTRRAILAAGGAMLASSLFGCNRSPTSSAPTVSDRLREIPLGADTRLAAGEQLLAQGALGYGLTSVFSAIPTELFQGPHFGTIFGTIGGLSVAGAGAGPWIAGALHDATGSYAVAFAVAAGCSVISAVAVWLSAPRKVRVVAGRLPR